MTSARSYIGKTVSITVDRPIHSRHPFFGWEYELNYGFVPGTEAPDGEELDAYVVGVTERVGEFTGTCVAVIHRTNDNDDKLVVVPESHLKISDEDIRNATRFQERFFESEILRI